MRHFAKISLFVIAIFIWVALSGILAVALADEFVPSSAQATLLGQIADFIARQRTGSLPALILLSGVAGSWRVIQEAWNEFSRVALEAWVWRWSLRVLLIVLIFVVGGAAYHSKTDAIATAGLPLPEAACKRSRQDLSTAIVLLHGWDGAADTTWNNFPKLICEDPTLSDTDLFIVDYPIFLTRRELSIAELGQWLRQSFFSDTLRKYSQVHIIAHSMGGPIARDLYVEDILAGTSKIRSIITIGSPFLGAQMAALAHALGISADLTGDMAPGSVFLKALAIHWTNVARRPATYCFTSPQDDVVSSDSAKYQCDCAHDYPQWGHVDMVKPILATDERYRMPIRALRNVRIAAQMDSLVRSQCFDLADARTRTRRASR
jgi:pimeloyl-ACP methyl ester carboxylesterase